MMAQRIDAASRLLALMIPTIASEADILARTGVFAGKLPDANRRDNGSLGRAIETLRCEYEEECAEADAENPTPVQNLKLELAEFVTEIEDNIRANIKAELKMELFLEMESMLEGVKGSRPSLRAPTFSAAQAATKPEFTGLSPFGRALVPTHAMPMDAMRTGAMSKHVDAMSKHVDAMSKHVDVIPESLANNSLFASVSKRTERAAAGKSLYTVDDIIKSRAGRFDVDTEAYVRETAALAQYDGSAAHDRWRRRGQGQATGSGHRDPDGEPVAHRARGRKRP